LKIILTLVGGR